MPYIDSLKVSFETNVDELIKTHEHLTELFNKFKTDVLSLNKLEPYESEINQQIKLDALKMLCDYLEHLKCMEYKEAQHLLDTFLNTHPIPSAACIRILNYGILLGLLVIIPVLLIVSVNPIFGFLFLASAAAFAFSTTLSEVHIHSSTERHQYAQAIHTSASTVGNFFKPSSATCADVIDDTEFDEANEANIKLV